MKRFRDFVSMARPPRKHFIYALLVASAVMLVYSFFFSQCPPTLRIVSGIMGNLFFLIGVAFWIRMDQRIIYPPGTVLLAIANYLCSDRTREVLIYQIIEDMRIEYREAFLDGRKATAFWILTGGCWGFWKALALHSISANPPAALTDWDLSGKRELFTYSVQQLEAAHSTLRISLDEALQQHNSGNMTAALPAVAVTPALCAYLTNCVGALLGAIESVAMHYGALPSVGVLEAQNFKTIRGRRAAQISSAVYEIFPLRLQFIYKVGLLTDLIVNSGADFSSTVELLTEKESGSHPEGAWNDLDAIYFDLSTCLQESIALFKSFLEVLPDGHTDMLKMLMGRQTSKPIYALASPATN